MVVARDAERDAVARVIESARRGDGGSLVLVGEPGAGKSVLLADAVATARDVHDLRVLRVRGVESEYPLPFAALHRVLRPLMRAATALPARQERALRVALGEVDADDGGGDPGGVAGAGSDRFLVYLAVLGLLSEAAEERPVLVAVDDAHWLDEASREALLFVARRVEGERLAVVFAAREDAGFDAADLPALPVRGLDLAGTRTLLTEHVGDDVPAAVAAELHARTAGNPLALSELAQAVDRAVLLGRAQLPAELPLTGGVEAAFLDRYRRLPAEARAVLLVAAADDSGDLAVVQEAAAALGADDAATEAAERSGLLTRRGDRVELRHPLVRSAVYAGATTPERRRTHAALADVL
ncbi:AAA family ATPase, partial [Actinotalea ferrariae]|uniref:AAA family ATPase n=1 Tax=Actinotalea ferrariae TaxID=1386098 RepID=UPI001C8BA32B